MLNLKKIIKMQELKHEIALEGISSVIEDVFKAQ